MFTAKPTALALTLLFYIALALVLATASDAKGYAPIPVHRRDHVHLNRLIRKRTPQPQDNPGTFGNSDKSGGNADPGVANGAGADPPSVSSTSSAPAAASSTPLQSTPSLSNTPSPSKNTPSSSSTSSTPASLSSSTSDTLALNSVVSLLTNTASSSSVSSSTSSSSSASSLFTSSSPTASTSPIVAVSNPVAPTPTSAHVTVTTQASEASASSSAAPTASASKITRTTLTVLIVIASCVGGTAIIWTIIRKWKLRTSSQFDERMRPIDWQPTTSDDGVPGHHRAGSSASSFHSGSGHDGLADGYGSTIDHGRSPSPLPPIPDHDFTAGPTGPATLAPVGVYADLARGPSPRPQMQEALTRGPSLTRPQYDQYGVPLHHQGGYGTDDPYDYNGARY